MRLTEKRKGINVIPLRYAVYGKDIPFWGIDYRNQTEKFLYGDAADKLSAYEDAEDQGRLVILPCKVGDTVYWCPDLNDRTWILSAEVTEIFVLRGGQIRISLPDINIEPIVPNAHLFFTAPKPKPR